MTPEQAFEQCRRSQYPMVVLDMYGEIKTRIIRSRKKRNDYIATNEKILVGVYNHAYEGTLENFLEDVNAIVWN